MKVFMIGGTGLLGSEAAKELIARGHEVSSIALPPLPQGAVLPKEMKIEYGNYLEMSDDEMRAHMKGCDGFVFAAGRKRGAKPRPRPKIMSAAKPRARPSVLLASGQRVRFGSASCALPLPVRTAALASDARKFAQNQ